MTGAGDYLPRHLDQALVEAVAAFPIVVLDGARGVGKTTTARRLARSVLMLPRDQEPLNVDADAYLRSLPAPVLVDEWQLAGTDLLWTLKRIVDEDPQPGRFLLTGSVEPAAYGPTYPLTGRAVRLVMRPMTAAELRGRGAERTFLADIAAGRPIEARSVEGFEVDQLAVPGFPAARSLPDARLFLDAYTSVVSQRAGEEGRDAGRLLRTMRVLATLTGQAVPDQRIWEAADINKATWKAYEDLLGRAHLSAPLPALESSRLKRLTSYPKRFLSDTAMAMALSDISATDLVGEPSLAGPYFESFVMQQLRSQADGIGSTLWHLRTGAGDREVDAVIELGRRVVAFEVKLAARPTRRDVRQIEWLHDQMGERFHAGYVVHSGSESYPLGERVIAIPVGVLMSGTG